VQADTVPSVVEADDGGSVKRDDVDAAELNEVNKPHTEERKTRAIKPFIRYRDETDLLVTSRPVRKRHPIIYVDPSFDKPARSVRKTTLPAKSHGSCLLPPDFDSSLSRSPGAARQSWKTILDGPERPSSKAGAGRQKKTKRQYRRRKGVVAKDEVQWTIHKKLLLGGSTPKKRKSASRSEFPRKQKLKKSPPKLSTVGSIGGKLWTRSMTRIQSTSADKKIAADTLSANDVLIAVGALKGEDELPNVGVPTSSTSNSALPSTDDAGALSLNFTPTHLSAAATKPGGPLEDKSPETISSDASRISLMECIELLDKDDAVEAASAKSPHGNVQHQQAEPEPEMPPADVMSVDEASTVADKSATKTVVDGSTSTAATNTDETKVDDESVEALMHLVKQLQDAVANEKLRKAKGALFH